MEYWKHIKGTDGNYKVSTHGRVFSVRRDIILKQSTNLPYNRVTINGDKTLVHRLVAEHFIPNPHNKPQVHHKDGDSRNNRVENLMWVTQQENNSLSRYEGERARNSKLKERDVLLIRDYYSKGYYNQKELADMFNCTRANISRITRRVSWSHI